MFSKETEIYNQSVWQDEGHPGLIRWFLSQLSANKIGVEAGRRFGILRLWEINWPENNVKKSQSRGISTRPQALKSQNFGDGKHLMSTTTKIDKPIGNKKVFLHRPQIRAVSNPKILYAVAKNRSALVLSAATMAVFLGAFPDFLRGSVSVSKFYGTS